MSLETIDSKYEKPEILGPQEFSLPFKATNDVLQSAFGEIVTNPEEGDSFGLPRICDQVFDDLTPPDLPAEIAIELGILDNIKTQHPYLPNRKVNSYVFNLERAYKEAGGSVYLRKIQSYLGEPPEVISRVLEKSKLDLPLRNFSRLHHPMTEEETDEMIRQGIQPFLASSFGAYYNFIAFNQVFAGNRYENLARSDERYKSAKEKVAAAMEYSLIGKSYEEITDWLVDDTGNPLMLNCFGLLKDEASCNLREKQIAVQSSALQREAIIPLIRYFDPDKTQQVNFDEAKKLHDYLEDRAAKEQTHDARHRYEAAAGYLVSFMTNYNSAIDLSNKVKTIDIINLRHKNMVKYGLSPDLDAMVFFYEKLFGYIDEGGPVPIKCTGQTVA